MKCLLTKASDSLYGKENKVIEINSMEELKTIACESANGVIVDLPYDKLHIENGIELVVMIYDDYVE